MKIPIIYRLAVIKEKLSGYKKQKQSFYKSLGYHLNLKHPKSYNEKIVWKKIYDRNPLLTITADKYKVRDYLKMILGDDRANSILIPLLHVTDKPDNIPFDKMPEEYMVKANHGSGMNIIIEKGMSVDKKNVISTCKEWLNRSYGFQSHEWAYQKIDRKIIVEKLIRDEKGCIPKDYKFHIMNGKCKLIGVYTDRFKNVNCSLFDPNWNLLDVSWEIGSKIEAGNYVYKPDNLQDMINIAEKLGIPFDYVRIDLYSINGKIYFGEFTHYPGGGIAKIDPVSFDYELGAMWKIKKKYWKNINKINKYNARL